MHTNTILAIIIVLLFIFVFVAWVFASIDVLLNAPGASLNIIVPGLVMFGFWGLVAWKLYHCESESFYDKAYNTVSGVVSDLAHSVTGKDELAM